MKKWLLLLFISNSLFSMDAELVEAVKSYNADTVETILRNRPDLTLKEYNHLCNLIKFERSMLPALTYEQFLAVIVFGSPVVSVVGAAALGLTVVTYYKHPKKRKTIKYTLATLSALTAALIGTYIGISCYENIRDKWVSKVTNVLCDHLTKKAY